MPCLIMERHVSDFQVRELSRPNQLRIQLGTSMDEKGHPFYQMPEVNPAEGKYTYDYQRDPRLNWVVETLQRKPFASAAFSIEHSAKKLDDHERPVF